MAKSDLEVAFDTQFHRLAPELPKPIDEHQFDPQRKWRLDRAWPDHRVAVEIEGGSHPKPIRCHRCGTVVHAMTKDGKIGRQIRMAGAHGGAHFQANLEKHNAMAVQGWLLLRFAHDDIVGKPFEMI